MASIQESGRSPERLLEGKVVVITGGSRGIGAAAALEFARQGANLVISSTPKSENSALQVVQEIESIGRQALWVPGDINDPATGERIIQRTVEKFGRIDVLVNNVGTKADALFVKMTPEQWENVIKTNLIAPFYVTQAAVKLMMRQRSGSIIFISSPASTNAYIGQSNYSASKGGIDILAETLSKELERFNVTVNVVAPGLVETDLTKDLPDKKINAILADSPTGKLASMENVTAAIVEMAKSDRTGQRVEIW
ncbi:MAG: SDR family NAD(P)-dependent oxidoreductase [Candidatus Levybacteria bacterium]|nr:SDR family NAD(P)-dependent oxidoreductase [Candidatus Levybacteria bacterium]